VACDVFAEEIAVAVAMRLMAGAGALDVFATLANFGDGDGALLAMVVKVCVVMLLLWEN